MSDSQESSGPFTGPTEKFRQEVERFVERVTGLGERALDTIGIRVPGSWTPPVDIIETTEGVVVTLDVPGISSEGLSVQIAGNMLTVSGSREAQGAPVGAIVHAAHRPSGSFSRSIPMPVPVDHDQVAAETHNGVLTIRLMKPAEAKARSIPIATRSNPESVAQV